MKSSTKYLAILIFAGLFPSAVAHGDTANTASAGETIEIQMLNVHPEDPRQRMVFYPRVVEAEVGDTITFLPTEPGHQASSTRGMIPDGAEPWKSRFNQEFSYTIEEPGVYGYQCDPHVAAGMVGLIVVNGEGKLDNLEEAKSVRQMGMAARIWPQIWAEAEEAGYLAE